MKSKGIVRMILQFISNKRKKESLFEKIARSNLNFNSMEFEVGRNDDKVIKIPPPEQVLADLARWKQEELEKNEFVK